MPSLWDNDPEWVDLARRETPASLQINATQRTTIIVACVYAVAIVLLWTIPILNYVIYPFKLLTVFFHEMSHAAVGLCTGAKIESIELEPNEGGVTRMRGGIPHLSLPAGYLGSSLIGAALIACGFDERASKVASIVVAVFFLLALWWARKNWLTWVLVIGMAGLIVAFWFIADSIALRYLVLFIGVMNSLYSLWDILDDLVFRKVNESDATAFSKLVGGAPQCWGVIWLIISMGFFAVGIIVGIVFAKASTQEQQADKFLDVGT